MSPTDALRTELRELLDETIPSGGTESDTRFATARIDSMLTAAASIYEAAAEGWTLKATRAMSERGGLEETTAGNERLKFASLTDYRDHCLKMAEMFEGMVPGSGGSRILAFDPPTIQGVEA